MTQLDSLNEKRYFTISEVSRATGVAPHSIRYWESEFKLLNPLRKRSSHRLYTKEDIEKLFKIKDLIYKHRLTLEGARKHLSKRGAAGQLSAKTAHAAAPETIKLLQEIHRELSSLLKE